MNFTRRKRVALELLGPPILGGVMVGTWAWGTLLQHTVPKPESIWDFAGQLPGLPISLVVYTVFAFPMIGLQAAAYAAIMEWSFSRGLSPRSWWSVVLSTALGLLSGLTVALGYGYDRKDTWFVFNVIGPIVGAALGLLMRKESPRRSSVHAQVVAASDNPSHTE